MRIPDIEEIHQKFQGNINEEWSFQENRSPESLTHGYHRYPAKFVPQLVKKLIEKYTLPGQVIGDVFAGCGTTLVEGKLHGLKTIGVDINPVAQLITRAKINPVKPKILDALFAQLNIKIDAYKPNALYTQTNHPRIDYWFENENKKKISFLYNITLEIENTKAKDFFLCALSNILKNCSKWLQDSTKPQIQKTKVPSEVFNTFKFQVKKMLKRNIAFYNVLKEKSFLSSSCTIKLADARKTRIRSNSLNAIITSPPYVTSYEYADIHQLTGYWFEYISDMTSFRKNFIGTFYSQNTKLKINKFSLTAENIVNQLYEKEKKLGFEVANYFRDMFCVAKEMHRLLMPNGVVCLVIGNTELRKVNIKSAESFAEMLYSVGFEIEEVIKREIPNKLIPTIRDINSGRFTTLVSDNSKKVYPNEYIIIARKSNGDN